MLIANALKPTKELRCEAPNDTGAAGVILPKTWKRRLGALPVVRMVDMESADRRLVRVKRLALK